MAKKPKDLLRKQELKIDNHHPLVPFEWNKENDKTIHLHKKMIVKNANGRKTHVSASINLNAQREIKVTYDDGKHSKLKGKNEESRCREQIKQEINECLSDPEEAAAFVEHIHDAILSLSSNDEELTQKRMNEAFDNVMDSLGISTNQKALIKKENGKLFGLYLTGNYPGQNHLAFIQSTHRDYRNHYEMDIIDEYPLYYIAFEDKHLNLGEYSPESAMTYAFKGYNTWLESDEELCDEKIEEETK